MKACHLIDTDNRKRNLTVDEQEKIKDLLSQGVPIKTVAKEINISFYKVSEFINEAGIILSCDTMTKGCDDALAEEWESVTNDLLSNAKYAELKHLRTYHKDLWDKLLKLENEPELIGNIWNMLTKTRIHDWEERFYWEDQQMDISDFTAS